MDVLGLPKMSSRLARCTGRPRTVRPTPEPARRAAAKLCYTDMSQSSDASVPPCKSADLVRLPDDNLNFGTPLARSAAGWCRPSFSSCARRTHRRRSYLPTGGCASMVSSGSLGRWIWPPCSRCRRSTRSVGSNVLATVARATSRLPRATNGATTQWVTRSSPASPCTTCSSSPAGSARRLSRWSLPAATMPAFSAPCRARSRSSRRCCSCGRSTASLCRPPMAVRCGWLCRAGRAWPA